MYNLILDFLHNSTFWAALAAWILAQCTKYLCNIATSRRGGPHWLTNTGGMPSAHSATVSSLATSIGWYYGFASPPFGFALAFAILTMFDASTVRRAAGMQATLLNEIIDEMFREHRLSQRKVRELLGHTRIEVFVGMIMGILVALIVDSLYA